MAEKKVIQISGNGRDVLTEIGKKLTRKLFVITVVYEVFDKKDKKWSGPITRVLTKRSLADAKHLYQRQIDSFVGYAHLKLLSVDLESQVLP